MTKFVITCPVCNVTDVEEKLKPVFHKTDNRGYILVIGIPNFHCENCNSITYRKVFGMKDILNEAYKNDYNTIIFDEKDWVDLLDL